MQRPIRTLFYILFFISFSHLLSGQPWAPGDVAIISVGTDISACGPYGDESDEISIVFMRAVPPGTTFYITDNGWEVGNPDAWGDSEGTLSLYKPIGTAPAGTVVTIKSINTGGNWTYTLESMSAGWLLNQVNVPGGPFNLEPGGDQIYVMEGGAWNNNGGGGDDATYNGNVLFGFNTLSTWAADGTSHQSNLYPDLADCFHIEGNGSEYYKYTNPLTSTVKLEWINRFDDLGNWTISGDCMSFFMTQPLYAQGYTIPIEDGAYGVFCPAFCNRCPPYTAGMIFSLPEGYTFDLTYTNGTESFDLFGVMNGDFVNFEVYDDITYWISAATVVGGCEVDMVFTLQANYLAPYNYPGEHTAIYICETNQNAIPLNHFLGGDPGGTWTPALQWDTYWYNDFGEGTWQYAFRYLDPMCPPDTATIDVIFPNLDGTTYEISCDQNGTPNDIFDDVIIIDIIVNGNNFGSEYAVTISSGTITPTIGQVGVPMTFTLSPGTANGPNLVMYIENINPPPEHINIGACLMDIFIEAPGFCSDPCDYDMAASLSGESEICINVCPDEPVYAEIEVSGGTEPYLMNFTVMAPGFPLYTFTEIPVLEYNEIEICIADIPAPLFNPLTFQLTLPASYAGTQATISLLDVLDVYECTANLEENGAYVMVLPLPVLDTFDFSICSSMANSINLNDFDEEITFFYDVIWYDGDPFGGGERIINTTTANLNNIVSLWALVEDDYCSNAIQVPFVILPSPQIDSIPPIEICEGSSVVLADIVINDAGNSNAVYTFHTAFPLDTTTQIDSTHYVPADTSTIYLLATAGVCLDTVPIVINIQPYPDFTLLSTPCNILLNTYDVLFTSSADSIHASVGTVINTTGQDMITGIPENTNVTIEVISASGLCKDTFLIVAPNCDCPLINPPVASQALYEICDDEVIPVFSVVIDAGLTANWFNVPSGGVALLTNSLTFQPMNLTPATYYAEAVDGALGCASIRTPIIFSVHPTPALQNVANPVLCATETINLDALAPGVLNGVNGTGSWFVLSTNQPIAGTIVPQNGDTWYYLFTSTAGACTSSDTITAVVNPLPVVDVFEILCDELLLTYNISFTTDADVVVASVGTLTNINGTDTFLISGVAYNTDIQISLEITSTGCTSLITQTAPDCSCPALLQQGDDELCSASGTVNLSDYQGSGLSGTWQMVSTPPGGNPATLTGSSLEILNADPGLYELRFIRSVILDDCVDSALFELNLLTSPFVDAGVDGTSCAPDAITLSGTGGGSNVQYTWQTNGAGTLANPNSLNTSYTPVLADFGTGQVSFTLTATDQTGRCPSAQETIDIVIDATAYFILNPGTQTFCDTADIIVDLDQFIDYGPTSGNWFFPVGMGGPILNNSELNPSTILAGNYIVYYTTTNAVAPCENDTVGLNLIIENCLCPSVALSMPSDALCSASGNQNLNAFLITTEPGSWSISSAPTGNNPATITGSTFTTNQSDPGIYQLRYTLLNPVDGCDPYAEIPLEVVATPALQFQAIQCAGDLLSWEVTIVSSAENVITSVGLVTPQGNNRYLITSIPAGSSLQVTASNGNGLCTAELTIPAPDCDCSISISNLPDEVLLCAGDNFLLEANVTGSKGDETSFWIVGNDTLYQTSLNVATAGAYTFVSIDSLGCRDQHVTDVSLYAEMDADIGTTDITCPGDADGSIILFDVQGGTAPYAISINGGPAQQVSVFPFEINNLVQGNYTIEITDQSNCMINLTVQVAPASTNTLTLGPDQSILIGDSLLISPMLSFTPDSFYWTGDIDQINPEVLVNWVFPTEDMSLQLFGIDALGCLYQDEILIRALLTSAIYIPNVFSPNGDGINDVFAPQTDPSIVTIDYFEIYSRWGEIVYSEKSFTPNQGGIGWDGTFRGKPMNAGVFYYRAGATNKRGKVHTLSGDLTLVR